MKHLLLFVIGVLFINVASSQELIPYTDSQNHFTLLVPQWRSLPQEPKSNVKLYLYDSSSAVECTAQRYLLVKIYRDKKFVRQKLHQFSINADSSKGILENGAQWHIHRDSVVCRPGERDYKISKDFITFTSAGKTYIVDLICTAIDIKMMLPIFLQIAASIKIL